MVAESFRLSRARDHFLKVTVFFLVPDFPVLTGSLDSDGFRDSTFLLGLEGSLRKLDCYFLPRNSRPIETSSR